MTKKTKKKRKKIAPQKTNIAKEADKEIEKKIIEMEKKDYQFPDKFSRKDYILTAATAIICLLTLIAGAYL